MTELKRFSLVKPTAETPFHIDFDWWKATDNDWRIYLFGFLCPEHQKTYANLSDNSVIDWIDPDTAEVTSIDGLQHVLMVHCAKQEEFINEHNTLVDGVFSILLSNGNVPLTAAELAARLGKPANTLLQTLGGPRVYRGVRPCQT